MFIRASGGLTTETRMSHVDAETAGQFAAGTLDDSAAAVVRRHIDRCDDCGRLVAQERAVRKMLHMTEASRPDGAALERLLTRVESAVAAPGMRRGDWLVLRRGGMALAGLALAALIYVLRSHSAEEERLARAEGMTPESVAAVVSRLDALRTLRHDPWVAHDFDTAASFSRLLSAMEKSP